MIIPLEIINSNIPLAFKTVANQPGRTKENEPREK